MAGRTKYGFKVVKGKLVEDEEQQKSIEVMIDMKANEATYAEIAHHLNSKNIPTAQNSGNWTKRRVEYLLSGYRDEICKKEEEVINSLYGTVETVKDNNDTKLPFEDAERCGSVRDFEWAKKLPDGQYILSGENIKLDEDDNHFSVRRYLHKRIDEKKATDLIEQFNKESEAVKAAIESYEERKRREPYIFDQGCAPFMQSNGISFTAKNRVQPARDTMEAWVDLINKPDKCLPATVKRKVRQIGRILCDKLLEQTQWHLHLAQEAERLHSKIYVLEQELVKYKEE